VTDDAGVKEMLAFNGARDTYHQQQQLQEDGFTDGVIEHSSGEWEDKAAACLSSCLRVAAEDNRLEAPSSQLTRQRIAHVLQLSCRGLPWTNHTGRS